jgi:hypothetical protein
VTHKQLTKLCSSYNLDKARMRRGKRRMQRLQLTSQGFAAAECLASVYAVQYASRRDANSNK